MKFTQVNEFQKEQANEACAVISKLRKVLAKQRLINKVFTKGVNDFTSVIIPG